MNAVLTILLLVACLAASFLVPTYGPPAVVLCLVMGLIGGVAIWRFDRENEFLVRLFVGAIVTRILVATLIAFYGLEKFFGGDSDTYDFYGWALGLSWHGRALYGTYVDQFNYRGGSGWGMLYVVAVIYELVGRNNFAVQLFNAVLGAATAIIVYRIAEHLFENKRVAKIAAIFVAFYPSMVLWSSQALKDGPIVFLLVIAMLCTLKIAEKFSVKYLVLLLTSVLCVLTLRFYIFYMVTAAIVGAFVIGMRSFSAKSFARQFIVVILMGLAMTYLGITRYASSQFEAFGDLKVVQRSRLDAARSAGSGFAADVDVSTTQGALAAIPIGVFYLMFAPLPWQFTSVRSMITLPEMIVWWSCFPLLILGLWFTIKHRLRRVSPILLFTTLLTLGYSIFQGNVGTAYRQRAQLLVFYFIFVAVGMVLFKERREDKKRKREEAKAAGMPARIIPPMRAPRDFGVKPTFQAARPAVTSEKR
jgi:4-amino-4-deoxy-L-arabinose transferase-like glycosyltransferase